ncbi:hypothetical protein MKW92_024047 [Papaver armeniacum]|nr:hypothetical protein MKW92_024047 [Papaver armeniacum]
MGMKNTVFGTPKTTPKKKTISKGTTPRRSPRLNSVDKSAEGASRKLSFMDVPISKHSQASSSGCSQSKAYKAVDIDDDDIWDASYWVKPTNEVKFVEDVENIQLENNKIDVCHPIEDPEAPPVFDSDEDIEFGSDEEEEIEEKDKGEEHKEEGGELFPEFEVFTPIDPTKMELKTRFPNKEAFKKYLRGYCVQERCQFILTRTNLSRIKDECRFKHEYDCPWFVYASKKEGEKTFVLRKMNLEHKCEGDHKNRNRSADLHYVKDFVLDFMMKNKPKKFVQTLIKSRKKSYLKGRSIYPIGVHGRLGILF